jgi:hypothetical protein
MVRAAMEVAEERMAIGAVVVSGDGVVGRASVAPDAGHGGEELG